ncbi:MAG: ATP-dependent metallopeptidase FtsH/Yme1/Tma family protein, partial [Proteobacteria bacterium]|nr:ATP-dependent metallopeptidase FtsH/Yme1/Tma family protein [Pseudomonadota bacterium]
MNDMGKNLLLWLIIAAVLLTVFQNFNVRPDNEEIDYSAFLEMVDQNQVRTVEVDGLTIRGERSDGGAFQTIQPQITDSALIGDMIDRNVDFKGKRPEQQSIWTQLLVASFPILVIIAVFMFFMRQMQGGAGGKGGPLTFGKSKAK